MLGPANTNKSPDVAPLRMVKIMAESLQELIGTGMPLSITTLLPSEAPKPEPEIPICVPTGPVVAEIFEMEGTAIAEELIVTLSNVAVAKLEVLPLATPRPM